MKSLLLILFGLSNLEFLTSAFASPLGGRRVLSSCLPEEEEEERVILYTSGDDLEKIVWFNKNKNWLMERSGGKQPKICQHEKRKGLVLRTPGRRLENEEVTNYLTKGRELDISHIKKIPKNLILVVYPPNHGDDLIPFTAPEGWEVRTAHHEDPLARGFLRQIGHLHGGLGVPTIVSYYLIQQQQKPSSSSFSGHKLQRAASVEDMLRLLIETPLE
jgi:hypothetical protein